MNETRRSVYELASAQRGLVTRADLTRLGVSRGERAGLRRAEILRPIGRQTFAIAGLPPDPLRSELAACLDTGGVLSHRSAARLNDISAPDPGPRPEVLVLHRVKPAGSPIALVHSTTWLRADDVIEVDGIPCTSVARTLFTLAGLVPEIPLDAARGAVDDAVRAGKASDRWLWWRLERLRCRGRNGVSVFEQILTSRAGGEVTESWLEREFLRLVRRSGLAVPMCQRRLNARGAFVARVDFLYEEARIVIEVTGAVAHSSREQRASDARRRNELSTLGYLVLEFTYEQVIGRPDQVVAQILIALHSRGHANSLA